ncbi:MAG: superoxide dismutase [Firmicutes bacterium]|nr:superoxide dismutase [Bacillota bacterium]
MTYPFRLKPLPYPSNALEPFIDQQTIEIHYGKHVQTYVDNLNRVIENRPELQHIVLEELANHQEAVIRNNAGGIYNHDLFFSCLAGGHQIDEDMKSKLKTAALSVFGSGWAWIVRDPDGELQVLTTPNQDPPDLMKFTPILNIDVWEHSYYLKYQNRRAEYIDNCLSLLTGVKIVNNKAAI